MRQKSFQRRVSVRQMLCLADSLGPSAKLLLWWDGEGKVLRVLRELFPTTPYWLLSTSQFSAAVSKGMQWRPDFGPWVYLPLWGFGDVESSIMVLSLML